ncbi:hypothetical protein L2E82_45952 [Cichorium intybus]|uniref:Uncharacterized protein n=1 Tax=Cichorium intybus TaxID=13427 RepID=A0ACB8ZVR9_CICIN|nr:hypothetical protein L2E82_45952 [Cichorium intybus]
MLGGVDRRKEGAKGCLLDFSVPNESCRKMVLDYDFNLIFMAYRKAIVVAGASGRTRKTLSAEVVMNTGNAMVDYTAMADEPSRSPPQAKTVGSTNDIVCPDEGCLPDGAPPLTDDGCLEVPIGGKKALKVTKESTSFENAESNISLHWLVFL